MGLKGIPKRLLPVDTRIAKISRRLGLLVARLYFKPVGSDSYSEVTVFDHVDLGLTAKNWKTGTEIEAFRYQLKVSKAWYEAVGNQGVHGTYALQLSDGAELLPCELETQTVVDKDTFATLTFRITQTVAGHSNTVSYT